MILIMCLQGTRLANLLLKIFTLGSLICILYWKSLVYLRVPYSIPAVAPRAGENAINKTFSVKLRRWIQQRQYKKHFERKETCHQLILWQTCYPLKATVLYNHLNHCNNYRTKKRTMTESWTTDKNARQTLVYRQAYSRPG